MKTVLVPFTDDDVTASALAQACMVGREFGGHVEGLFINRMRPQREDGTLADEQRSGWRRLAERASARFSAIVGELGVPLGGSIAGPADGASASWREVLSPDGAALGDHGRAFDLIVMGRSGAGSLSDWRSLSESAFFESGRPVILAANDPPSGVGRNVVIHWNGTTEAAKAVGLAQPFLERAQAVTVVEVEEDRTPGPRAGEVAAHLRRAGVRAEVRTLVANGHGCGETLLDAVRDADADLLVKGAYSQNRLRRSVLGPVTRHVMEEATVPVFLAA